MIRGAILGLLVAACSTPDATSVPRLSPLVDGPIGLVTIDNAINDEGSGIHCGPPGSGGGTSGQAPRGGLYGVQNEYTTCEYPGGNLADLTATWERLGAPYLETRRVTNIEPGSFEGEDLRGLVWTYTYGPATGVLTITIVPVGDDTYRVLGNLQESTPGTPS